MMLGALAGFTAAVTMTHNAWARYHEPFLLLFAAVCSALVVANDDGEDSVGVRLRALRFLGVAALCCILAAVTVQKTLSEPVERDPKARQDATNPPLELSPLWPASWDRRGNAAE